MAQPARSSYRGANFRVQLIGADKMKAALIKAATVSDKVSAQATQEIANKVYKESQTLVPVDTGQLKSSGRVQPARGPGKTGGHQVVYETPYAVFVHERLDQHHDAPTQAKFLEQPFLAHQQELEKILAQRMHEVFLASSGNLGI